MSDPNTQPAPTLEETEDALARMPTSVAASLRRHMGLPPAEPEPLNPAPESVRAEIREQLAAFAATPAPPAPPMNPEARQRLDAQVAECNRRKAEEEANRAKKEEAKRAAEQDPAIVAALEPIKERAARLSPVKRRMIESSVQIAAAAPDEVVFQHSVFCQTVLPYRDPGPEVRKWERVQGDALLQINAGEVADTQRKKFIPVGLPYGPAARLIVTHLNTEALKTRYHEIDTDGSMTAYIRRLTHHQTRGADIRRFKEQLLRLSGCLIRIAYGFGDRTIQVNSQIVSALDLWEECPDGQLSFMFPKTITLSLDYFENLMAHAVPLDERAIAALAHSAMALDIYAWLAQRLHRVDPQRGQFVPWTALHAQFGQGYDRLRDFRRVFRAALSQVQTQYPGARVKVDKGGMLLANSPPPVPSRRLILLPPAKTPKG